MGVGARQKAFQDVAASHFFQANPGHFSRVPHPLSTRTPTSIACRGNPSRALEQKRRYK